MKTGFLIFLLVLAAFSIYGILTLQPEFVIAFALLFIIVLIAIAADLIERFFPKSKLGKFIRKIEEFLFFYA